ncbi:MAG: PH domain-containing protein, partial [Proteobacteria bacterium]|nr:PH domain-containing protein [Pseudomonadota bacterium]
MENPFYFRPWDLVTVKIDGAGSSVEEVYLAALTRTRAEEIREHIRKHQTGSAQANLNLDQQTEVAPGSTLVLKRDLIDLIIHGLTNNRAWIILGAIAAIYGQAGDAINSLIGSFGFNLEDLITNASMFAILIIGFSVLTVAVMIMAGLSVLGSIFTYYRFELHRTQSTFTVFQGLLTRHEINLKKSRIQALRVRRDWLDMAL